MKTLKRLLLPVLVLCGLAFSPARVVAAPVTVSTTDYGPMNGFELYGNGLYWWNAGNAANEVTSQRIGQIAQRAIVAGRFVSVLNSPTSYSLRSTTLKAYGQGVGRTDDDAFFFADYGPGRRIHRRPFHGAAADDPGVDFSGVSYSDVGAILVNGGTVYWSARGGAAAGTGEIRHKLTTAGPGGGDAILATGIGLAVKMRVVTTLIADGGLPVRVDLFVLNDVGQLWRIRLPSFTNPTPGAPSLHASNVTDFDTRRETLTRPSGPFGFETITSTWIYMATGVNLGESRLSGRVVAYDFHDGSSFTFYDSQDVNLQVTGVALDEDRIYLTRTPLRFEGVVGGFGGWVYDRPNAQILRRNHAARRGIEFNFPFETVAITQEGLNLRSDGQWLFFIHQNQVRKLKTDAPALALDYRALGLEAVQAVQTYNNNVRLVAGKPTLVRGYAQLLQNTTGVGRFPLSGRIRAFRNGAQLPGEASSYNDPTVDTASDLPTLRGNLNRSFLFDLPPQWLNEEGPLQIQFTVNPNGTVPETGAAPLLNNSASITVNVVFRQRPSLVFNVMSSTFPNYDPNAPGSQFGDILDRALTQLPAPGFRTWFRSGSVTKPVVTLEGIKARSFDIPDDDDWALVLLSALQMLSKDPDGASDVHWVGMFPTQEKSWNGLGEVNGNTLLIRMGAENASNWMGPRGGFALAHELSHNYGRNHLNTPTNCTTQVPDSPYDSYDGSACTLGGTVNLADPAAPIGYDYRTGTLILPASAGDLMSYANTRWTSPQTWQRNLDSIPGGPAPVLAAAGIVAAAEPPSGPVIFVQGVLNTALPSGLLLPLVQGQRVDFDAAKVGDSMAAATALPADWPHRLQQRDGAGVVLSDVPAVTSGFTDKPDWKLRFAQFVPLEAGAAQLRLVSGGKVLAELDATPSAPAIALGAVALDTVAGSLALNWTASDADGDTLLFTVQFSNDDGASWQTLIAHDPSTSFATSTALLPGGGACRLRVVATDGFHATMATSEAFALAAHGPALTLVGLQDGQKLPFGVDPVARVFAYDAEDGSVDDAAVQWSLAGPVTRNGTGADLALRHLPPGIYSLTISAFDADGNGGVKYVSFEILPLAVPDATTPALDGLDGDDAYLNAPVLRLNADSAEPSIRLVHANGALYIAAGGLRRSDDGAVPAVLRFQIDADGAGGTAPQPDDYSFGVDEGGTPWLARGNGSGFVGQVPTGFSVQIMQGVGTWSAELRVPESLIGGWNHDARLAVVFERNECVVLPFLSCVSVPELPVVWPANAVLGEPTSWAPVRFGAPLASPNTAPIAVATGPAVVSYSEPRAVALDGAGSYDAEGDALSYAWTQTGGPAVTLNDAATVAPSFTASALGSSATVTFRLIVSDGALESAPATVSVLLAPVGAGSSGGTAGKVPIKVNPDGSTSIKLCWPGSAGDVVVIQASSDLVNWENIATNSTSFVGLILHRDAEAGSFAHRFYRAATWTPGFVSAAGSALEFDGTDGIVEVPHDAALNAFPLTIAFWLKTADDGQDARGLVSKYIDSAYDGYSLFLSGGHIRGWFFASLGNQVWDGALGFDSGFVADGAWHHIALVVDGVGGRLLVDGVTVSSIPWLGTPGAPGSEFQLQFGRYSNYPEGLAGTMDEIALWGRAFTDVEIQSMMNHALTGTEADLIGYWPLNEGAGPAAGDVTGHGHDGVVSGGASWIESAAPVSP